MHLTVIILPFLMCMLSCATSGPLHNNEKDGGAIEVDAGAEIRKVENLDTLVQQTHGSVSVPALGGAIVDETGLRALGVSGVRAVGNTDIVTAADPWHLGSNTKAITAVLAGRLVDDEMVSWGLVVTDVWPNANADWSLVSLEMLLHHRGGASDNLIADHLDLWTALAQAGDGASGRAALVESLVSQPPDEQVGTFAYSNAGYMIAGAMLEVQTGKSWQALLAEKVFEPLQMSCGFGAPTEKAPWGHRVEGGALRAVSPGPAADNPAGLGPAGTVHCSLADWSSFIAAQLPGHVLDDGSQFLKQETLIRLQTPTGDYAGGWIVTTRPWAVETGAGIVLTHSGSNTMWLAVAWLAPEKRRAYLAVVNAATPDATALADILVGALIEHDNTD